MAESEPDTPPLHDDHEDSPATKRNTRYGLILFALYFILYGGFMVLNVFYGGVMGEPSLGGVNVAILYGFGLIVAALALAGVYMYLCKAGSRRDQESRK